ncbi:efflux RND transporter permease subunit, partial [Kaarinaea lacus]
LILGLRGANAQQVVINVENKLTELQPSLPKGVRIEVFYNRSQLVDRAVNTVTNALTQAIVLVVILLVVLLGNLRAALTVALILPLAALSTFILMRWFDLSANLMSLGGLAIAIGMLVDGAVVVVENVVSNLEKTTDSRMPKLHIINRAAKEVAVPVVSGVLIIIIVFLPLLTLQGLEGKLFAPVALTIIFALASSIVLSLTVIPVFASILVKTATLKEPWLVKLLHKGYQPVLEWSLKHRHIVTVSALVTLVISFGIFLLVGKTFMPTLDEGNIIVQLEKLPSINLEESIAIDARVQQAILNEVDEVTRIVARTGSDEIGLDPMGLNQTDMFLVLKPPGQWSVSDKDALVDKLRLVLDGFPGVAYAFTQPIEMRVSEMLTGVRGDVAIKLFGPDLSQLNKKATEIAAVVEAIDGSEDVYFTQNEGVQYLKVSINRVAAGRYGFSIDELEDELRIHVEGKQVGTVYTGVRRTPLIVRGAPELRRAPDDFVNLYLTMADGKLLPLTTVAQINRIEGPVQVGREQGARFSVVIANVRDRDLVGFVEEAKQKVQQQVQLPQGYYVQWGGQFENQQRAAQRLTIVIPIALGLIFLLLFTTFRSVPQALLILTNIPFALIGGVLALWISGQYLSVPASVGFIALLGIAVLNGVVMISYFNQLASMGMPLQKILKEGAQRRLRPVMMTAFTTAFGLFPLLYASGPGSEIQKPLAIVVIGGLVTSTLLTLILLPILYEKYGFKTLRRPS